MSKERFTLGHERRHNPEVMAEIGAERSRELHDKLKENIEKRPENTSELTREAREKAVSTEKERKDNTQELLVEHRISNQTTSKDASFKATMHEIQGQMSGPSKTFSKIIHNEAVEKVSDSLGSTIVRPNAVLSGAILAFALTLGVYLVAKNLGYPLSGFETIAAFIIGWALGVIYDFLKVMITGSK